MPRHADTSNGERPPGRLVTLAYRSETGTRDRLARLARWRKWTTAAIAYPGYGVSGRARVLGRLLLAPPRSDPGARRDIPGWRRFLTLEQPGAEVRVTVGAASATATSDEAGLVDVVVETPLAPGPTDAVLQVAGRDPVTGTVHVAPADATLGVVCDIDDTALVTGLRHPLRAAWRTLARSSQGRSPVTGMPELLRRLLRDHPGAPMIYLSNGPWNLAGPITRFLDRTGFPPGPLLMTDWGITPRGWFRDGRAHKRAALERLAEDFPGVRWVLVGDDGEHDPAIYREFAERHPGRVQAIALRTVSTTHTTAQEDPTGDVPVVRAPDGDELAARLDTALPGRLAPARAAAGS